MGEGAEAGEHLLLVTLAKFCSSGLFLLGKIGDFPLFCRGVLGSFSCHLNSVSGAGNASQRGQVCFSGIKGIQCFPKTFPAGS